MKNVKTFFCAMTVIVAIIAIAVLNTPTAKATEISGICDAIAYLAGSEAVSDCLATGGGSGCEVVRAPAEKSARELCRRYGPWT